MKKPSLFALLIVALLLSACAPSAPEAEAQFCQSLTDLGESLRTLKAVDIENDQEGLEAAWEDTLDSYAQVRETADKMRDVKLSDLQLAWRNLEITVGSSLAGAPPDEAKLGIEKAWNDVKEAYDELYNVNCGN